jgi:hypothetical protein
MIWRFISLKWQVALALKCTRSRKVRLVGRTRAASDKGDPKQFRTKDLGSRFATSRKVPVVRDLPCHVCLSGSSPHVAAPLPGAAVLVV